MANKTVKVPLFSSVYRNVDGAVLNDNNALVIDGYLDELGGSHRRPGLESFVSLTGTGNCKVSGAFYWPHKNIVIAVCHDQVFKITETGTVTNITGDKPNTSVPPVFTTDGGYCYIASGGQIIYTNGTTATDYVSANAPQTASHVAYIDGYIVANESNSNIWYSSELADFSGAAPVTWPSPALYGQAVGDPDYIKAISVLNREVYLFGSISTEIWENVGNTFPFERISGGFIQTGCSAPYSVITSDSAIYWLDHTRHFVRWSNGELSRISSPYDKEIQGFSTVGDCTGSRIEIAGRPFIVWQFPSESKTLVFDFLKPNWVEWRRWDSAVPAYYRWLGNCYTWAFGWSKHIIGSSVDSTIYLMSDTCYTDGSAPIRHERTTGHIDYGTSKRKRCNVLRGRLKRGSGLSGRTPKIILQWNDDNRGFGQELGLSLGDAGDNEIIVQCFPRGIYRTRQYKITATDGVDIVYADFEEDIEVLE